MGKTDHMVGVPSRGGFEIFVLLVGVVLSSIELSL
jgi:hypothetical protein